jgi:TPR repeat protein
MLEMAIAAGNVADGARMLGNFYRDARPPQIDKATAAYQRAIAAGSTSAMLALANIVRASDPNQAHALIEKAIAGGQVADGAAALGDFYRSTTPPQLDKAAAAYRQVIAAGNTWGYIALADLLKATDPVQAKSMLDKAIAAGNVKDGAAALANLYRRMRPPQPEKAVAAYQQAIGAGNTSAMLALADMVQGSDAAQAKALIERAINAGAVEGGSVALGNLYRDMNPSDGQNALASYQPAIRAGNSSAMLSAAGILTSGQNGVPTDTARAKALIENAIAVGDVQYGAFALGVYYRDTSPDLPKAAEAFRSAADAGSTPAMLALANMLINGRGVSADAGAAKALIERAIAAGEVSNGAMALGDFYSLSDPPDVAKAIGAYQQAAQAGNAGAYMAAATMEGSRFTDAATLKSMVGHLRAAAKALPPDEVATQMLHLPASTLIASVQQMLNDNGQRVGGADGVHSARTSKAIGNFCVASKVSDCHPDFVTKGLLVALLTK